MRRSQNDSSDTSRPLRNLVTNPELVADVSDRLLFKNTVTNPSFEAASGTTTVRTNLSTNPGFDTSSGPVTVRTNLATNPGFESTGADTNVNYNLVPYPSFELSSGTATVRTNISTNPGMETPGSAVNVRTNLATNPGFETASGSVTTVRQNLAPNPVAVLGPGWFGANGAPSTGTTGVAGGPPGISTMARLAATGTGTGTNYFAMAYGQSTTTGAVATPGLNYVASMYVRVNMVNFTQQPVIRLRWKTSTGTTISDVTVPAVGYRNGQWMRLSASGVAPATTAYIELMVGYTSIDQATISVGDVVEATGVLVEQATTLGSYFDASNPAPLRMNLHPDPSFEFGIGNWINNGPGSMDLSSTYSFTGTKSLKVVPGQENWGYYNPMNQNLITPGQTYTFSLYVYSETAQSLCLTNYNTPVLGPTVAVPAGVWTRLYLTQTIPVNATNIWLSVRNPDRVTTPGTFYMDAFLIEQSNTLGSYFDGNTVAASGRTISWTGTVNGSASVMKETGFTYAWSGTANASTSHMQAPSLAGVGQQASLQSRVYQKSSGNGITGKSAAIYKQQGYGYINIDLTGLKSSTTYTYSVDVLSPIATVNTVDRGTTAAPTYAPADKTVTPNVVTRISRSFTTGASDTTRTLSLVGWEAATAPDGSTMVVDNLLIEEAQVALPYFDGTTPTADGLAHAWSGTVDASTSTQDGVQVSNRVGLNPYTVGWQSSKMSRSGSKSAAFLTKLATPTNTTMWYPAADYIVGAADGQLPANTQITWSVYVWVPSGAGNVRLMESATGVQGTSSTLYDQWERLSLTVTTGASGTIFFRLRSSGTVAAGQTIYVDEELIEAANGPRPYFDASNPIRNICTNPSFTTNVADYTVVSASLTRVAGMGDGFVGELTQTIANGTRQSAVYINSTSLPADTYYVSFDMSGSAAEFTNVRVLLYDSITATQTGPSYTTPLIKTGGFNRYTAVITATAPFNRVYMETQGVNIPVGTKSWIDRVVIERGSSSGVYYEGLGDFTYGWTGTANSSMSQQMAPNAAGWAQLGSLYRSAIDPKIGPYSAALLTRGLNGDGLWPGTNLDVFGGRKYWFSAWVKTTSVHGLTVAFRWSDASFVSTGTDTNVTVTSQLTVGQWSLITASAIAPANTAKLQMMTRIYETHTPTTFYMDGAMVVESDIPVPYFDGSTPASGDFNYSWAGTANASVSRQRGASINDLLSYSAIAVSSSAWKASGSKSARVVSTITTANDTFVSLTGDTGAMRNGFVAGKTYTVSATCRLEAPLTGTLSLRSRKIVFFHRAGGTGNYTEVGSTQAPNVAGETRVSMTFTIPADATEGFIRLYNGSYAGNGDVWWDNLLIEETTYLKPYFDGNTPSVENLAKDTPVAFSNTTHTAGVSYGGSTWTRSSVPANGSSLTRQYVNNYFLVSGETYTTSVTVANDQSTPQQITFDWCDVGSVTHTLAPGEIKRITTSGVRPMSSTYGTTYRFSDIHVTPSATEARSILFKDWLVELGTTSGEYYTGTGDFNFAWTGTANASTSVMTATGLSNLSAAWNAVCYRTGTVGNYRGRVMFTSGTITDSGLAFGMVSTLAPSKVYTVSVDITSDTSRNVRFSSQGTGTVMAATLPIALTAGVKTRQSFTFTTTATAPAGVSLYVLRSDLLPGTIEFDNMLIEEVPFAAPYFDGSTPDKINLAVNPNLDTNANGWATNDGTTYPAARSTVSPIRGTASYLSTRTATSLNSVAASVWTNGKDGVTTSFKVTPGEVYSFSLDVLTSQSNRRASTYVAFRNSAGNSIGSAGTVITNLTANTVQRVGSAGVVVPATADSMLCVANVTSVDGSNAVAGEETRFDGLLIEKSATISEYFEGTGDFSYAWTGVANASTSTKSAPAPSGTSGNYSSRVAWQSDGGPVTGKKSVAVISGYPSVDAFTQFNLPPFAGETLAGRTFTIIATRKSSHDLAASANDGRCWRPLWQVNKTDGTGYDMIMPPTGPTTAGIHKMKYTFTFGPTVTTSAFFRLYNGNATQNTTVWWDDVAVIEGAYPGEYFDGDTPDTADNTYLWDGTANASTSSMRGLNIKGTWFGHRAVVTASSDKPFSGSHKVKASVTEIGYFPRLVSNTFPVEAGKAYTAFAKMKCSSQPVQIALAWITVNGSSTSAIGQSASNGNWVRVSQTAIAPVDATHVQLYMGLPNNTPLTTEFEIDSIMLVAKDYDGPFGSGDTYGWTWEGTPHASTSKGYPTGLVQLAGKPLFVGTLSGPSVLTNIDPAKNPVIPADAPRTIYTIVDNLQVVPTGQLPTVWVYGVDSLTDTVPNTTIILRQQSQAGNLTNTVLARRTGGGGPNTLNVPSVGKQILIAGVAADGTLFSAVNKSALTTDNVPMSIPHERINISPDSVYHRHVVTYIYPGVHSSAVRAEMVKLLASEWNVPGM